MNWKKELAKKYGGQSEERRSGRARHVAGEMNATEKQFAEMLRLKQLAGDILQFEFEAIKFRIGDRCFYTPDFVVWQPFNAGMVAYEIKGHWEDDARVKIKAAAARYPQVSFIAVKKVRYGWNYEEIKSR